MQKRPVEKAAEVKAAVKATETKAVVKAEEVKAKYYMFKDKGIS